MKSDLMLLLEPILNEWLALKTQWPTTDAGYERVWLEQEARDKRKQIQEEMDAIFSQGVQQGIEETEGISEDWSDDNRMTLRACIVDLKCEPLASIKKCEQIRSRLEYVLDRVS